MRLFPHNNYEIPSYSKPSTIKYRIAQIVFHVGFFLGFFPVKYDQATQEFTFQPACALVFGVFWAAVFCLFLYLQLDFIFMIAAFGKATVVGCNQSVMRGTDYIYSILSALYFLYDFFILVSAVFFARHLAPALTASSILVKEFLLFNKKELSKSSLYRPSLVSCLPVLAQMIWQTLFHVKKSCILGEFPSTQSILASVLYILLDLRSYLGILVFYDSLFLYTMNAVMECVKITMESQTEEKLLKNCTLMENLLSQLQEGFSYYLFVHMSMLVLFSTLNTHFAIICGVISLQYSSWYKLCEICGILAMGAHTWMRIFYLCSAGQQVGRSSQHPSSMGPGAGHYRRTYRGAGQEAADLQSWECPGGPCITHCYILCLQCATKCTVLPQNGLYFRTALP